MIFDCKDCAHCSVCKYKEETNNFEKLFNLEQAPDFITINIECKYMQKSVLLKERTNSPPFYTCLPNEVTTTGLLNLKKTN